MSQFYKQQFHTHTTTFTLLRFGYMCRIKLTKLSLLVDVKLSYCIISYAPCVSAQGCKCITETLTVLLTLET